MLASDILDSLSVIPLISNVSGSLVDVGSGAGLPGIPVALATGLATVLLDAKGKAARFLADAIAATGAPARVEVARAEDAARGPLRESFSLAVARAVAPLSTLCELALPLVAPGGLFLAMKAAKAQAEAAAASEAARMLGGGAIRVVALAVPFLPAERAAVLIDKERPTPAEYPRRAGVPERRPLG